MAKKSGKFLSTVGRIYGLLTGVHVKVMSMGNCTTIHRCPLFSTRYSVMCESYTGYCGTSEIEHGLCACTVDNPLAKARGLSIRTGVQTMLYLSHIRCSFKSSVYYCCFIFTLSKYLCITEPSNPPLPPHPPPPASSEAKGTTFTLFLTYVRTLG